MRAVVCREFGGPEVLDFCERPIPQPGPDEILVKVRATTVNSADWRLRSMSLPPGFGALGRLAIGFSRPRNPVLGSELAGDVVAVGSRVSAFKPGDAVFAFTGSGLGCHVEYRCLAANGAVALKPPDLSYAQAAALSFGGATMLDFYGRAALKAGERVLVNGATGTVGTAAVQLARHFGAHVTAVCRQERADLVSSLGAHRVIDRESQDFAAGSTAYDVIVDTAGTAPFARCAPVLAPRGRLLLVLATLAEMLRSPWNTLRSGKRVIAGPAAERAEYVHRLRDLACARHFLPVIDRTYPFDEIRAAHEHVDRGHKAGSVVVEIEPGLWKTKASAH